MPQSNVPEVETEVETEEDVDLIIHADDARWDEEDDFDQMDWVLMGLRDRIEKQGSIRVMN